MNLFVTGATGFIGSHLVRRLLLARHDVRALRRPGSRPRIALEREPTWIDGSLDTVREDDLHGVDCLIHLAAHGVNPDDATWSDCFHWNVQASLDLWRRAARVGVTRFLVCGSCFEYGRSGERYDFIPANAPLEPTGPYHASKAAATMAASALADAEHCRVWVVRPFHVYGEGEGAGRLYPQVVAAARAGRDLPLTAGEQVRDFTEVSELARLIHGYCWLLNASERPFRVSNLGTGRPRSLGEFAREVWQCERATGRLLFGELPYRDREVMRYVPLINGAERDAALAADARP